MEMFNEGKRFYRCIRKVVRRGRLLYSAAHHLVREEWLGQYVPSRPIVLQFPVNDICNSRCVMCNIWQRKRDREITPEELRHILADALFNEIRYVGINGGEPTLRSDLPDIGRVLVESLPKLRGMGIITNALRPRMVVERLLPLYRASTSFPTSDLAQKPPTQEVIVNLPIRLSMQYVFLFNIHLSCYSIGKPISTQVARFLALGHFTIVCSGR